MVKTAHEHENQSSCGHVPRHRRNNPSCYTSECVISHRVKSILSSYSFLFLDTPCHCCMRQYSCCCKACSLVCGRGHGCVSRGQLFDVSDCHKLRSKLRVWKKGQFTVSRVMYTVVEVWITKELSKAKSGASSGAPPRFVYRITSFGPLKRRYT